MPRPKTKETTEPYLHPIRDIPIVEIDIPHDRARSFNDEEAEAFSYILAAQGLQHPIRVRIAGNRFRLISGRKRLEAFRLLQWEAIPTTISNASTDDEARLEEVMENLGRVELDALDRCHHLYELKQVYERLHPAAKHGGDRGNQHTGGKTQKLRLGTDEPEVFGFAAATAEKIGLSRRSIELAVKIWTDLTPDSRTRLSGTIFAKRQSAIKELSEQTPADQSRVLDMLFADAPAAATVADAVAILKNGVAMTPVEKKAEAVNRTLKALPGGVAETIVSTHANGRLAELREGIATLSKFFGKLEDEELDTVIAQHEERIIASLKRRGRI